MARRAYVRTDRFESAHTDVGWFLLRGVVGGLVAGIIFSIVGLLAVVAAGEDMLFAAQGVAAPYTGANAAASEAIPVAVLAMLLYSIGGGLVIGGILAAIPHLNPGGAITLSIVLGFFFGFVYWFLHSTYYWNWFPSNLHGGVQVLLFGLYGLIVGLYMAAIAPVPTVHATTDIHETSTVTPSAVAPSSPQQTVVVDKSGNAGTTHSHGTLTHTHSEASPGHTHTS